MTLTAFLLSIMAGVIANRISKWLDERAHDGDEPRD
ncbi:nitrate reductase [Selenomonas sputigena]|nr:nitrate reductase [Selenomonas sputigena]UZE44991.1 nitrate reductase [Selenomonas sputigena]